MDAKTAAMWIRDMKAEGITMCYAAVDPKQPGAAFAVRVDDGEDLANMYKALSKWAKRGGVPTRMPLRDGVAMLRKWVRPARNHSMMTVANRRKYLNSK